MLKEKNPDRQGIHTHGRTRFLSSVYRGMIESFDGGIRNPIGLFAVVAVFFFTVCIGIERFGVFHRSESFIGQGMEIDVV